MSTPISPGATPVQPQGPQPSEILDTMLQLATVYLHVEPDDQNKLTMTQAVTQLRKILAKKQADARRAPVTMQTPMGARLM